MTDLCSPNAGTYNGSTMPNSTKLPLIASIVAFAMTGIVVLSSVFGPIILLSIAVISLCAGIGILRKRVWSAYGFAIYLFAQLFDPDQA